MNSFVTRAVRDNNGSIMSQIYCRFTHSFADQKPGDPAQALGCYLIDQLDQVLHTHIAGQNRERWKFIVDHTVEVGHIAGRQLAPINLAIINLCTARGELIAKQASPLLAAYNQHSLTRDLLQSISFEQGFAIVGRTGKQA
jgi:hypothetical protein